MILLDAAKRIAARTQGYHWKISKFHKLLHLVWYMIRYGGASNFDAGMGEKNHQILAKLPASSCQKRCATFEKQAMDRLHELFVLNRALEEFKENGLLPAGLFTKEEEDDQELDEEKEQHESLVGSSNFQIVKKDGEFVLYWPKQKKILSNAMPELVADIVSRYFVKQGSGEYVPKPTKLEIHSDYTSVDGTHYRAHPSFRKRQWNNWVTILWRK